MTTTLKKALALAMCLTMLVLAVPGFASGEATGPEANAAREMVNIRFSQYANSVDDQEGMANDPIKKAIEQIFGVKVEKVNTIRMEGKAKRQGVTSGRRANWKKAMVKLTADSKTIEFFEGMV